MANNEQTKKTALPRRPKHQKNVTSVNNSEGPAAFLLAQTSQQKIQKKNQTFAKRWMIRQSTAAD